MNKKKIKYIKDVIIILIIMIAVRGIICFFNGDKLFNNLSILMMVTVSISYLFFNLVLKIHED
ncbi:hypothetical protein [Anaerosporobacter sp.]|uniref:hypothetical protein n=1 Tax=Anaerosporobacter sp. TaxID=1872529 RepID=UPI00286EEE20|nr:hypothetical protein [Anaerosporobacter sp.]